MVFQDVVHRASDSDLVSPRSPRGHDSRCQRVAATREGFGKQACDGGWNNFNRKLNMTISRVWVDGDIRKA